MPLRRDPESDGPVAWVLPDRGILFVPQLLAPVTKRNPEVIQFWPGLMTGGAGQVVFPRECGDGTCGRTKREKHSQNEDEHCNNSLSRQHHNSHCFGWLFLIVHNSHLSA